MLSNDIHFLTTHGVEIALKVLAAVVCGFLLGYERQRRGKPVGILTSILVALGSTLFVIAGSLLTEERGLSGDATRLASMIVSGIGFIGAGAIMRSRFNVSGLASAATIWCLGGLGIFIGWGYVLSAVLIAGTMALLLRMIPMLEHVLYRQRFCVHVDVVVERDALEAVQDFLMENHLPAFTAPVQGKEGQVVLRIDQCGLESRTGILNNLRQMEGVVRIGSVTA